MIRIYNDNLGRILHFSLYQRIHAFCVKYSPELPADLATTAWLGRLYSNDLTLHLLAEVDDKYTITEHLLIDTPLVFGLKVIYVHQVQHDVPTSRAHSMEAMEYLDKLKEIENASAIIFCLNNPKHAKPFQERHNYKILRTVMIKTSEGESEDNG